MRFGQAGFRRHAYLLQVISGLGRFGLHVSEHIDKVGKIVGLLGEKFFFGAFQQLGSLFQLGDRYL
jgi:hypothetical protein